MGCYNCDCTECDARLSGTNSFTLMLEMDQHIKKKHKKIYKHNKKIDEEVLRLEKLARQYKIDNRKVIFTEQKWCEYE